jgi:hypothetical protein
MNNHELNLMFVPLEDAELLAGIVFGKLMTTISESKKIDSDIQANQIERLQGLYTKVVKHKNQVKKLNQIKR